ncbi:MAG: glycoside hydrolase family 73 protein [Peptoniphilaceae bacterium]
MSRSRRGRKKDNKFFFFSAIIFIIIVFLIISQENKETPKDFREEYLSSNTYLAKKIASKYKLYPSVILAQSALESNYGKSKLSRDYNNYFGIKALNSDSVDLNTVEYIDKNKSIVKEPFRVYKDKKDSFNHYGLLISKAKRYENVRKANSYKEAANALQKSGYATDPNYASKIIDIINRYNLDDLDNSFFHR